MQIDILLCSLHQVFLNKLLLMTFSASHLGSRPGHAWPVYVLLSGLQHEKLLLLTDLFGQNADLLHLFVLAVIIRVILSGSFLQLLLFLQIFQFLPKTALKLSAENLLETQLNSFSVCRGIRGQLQHETNSPYLHDVRINVISNVVTLPHLRDLIVLLILVHQIPVFCKQTTGCEWQRRQHPPLGMSPAKHFLLCRSRT